MQQLVYFKAHYFFFWWGGGLRKQEGHDGSELLTRDDIVTIYHLPN